MEILPSINTKLLALGLFNKNLQKTNLQIR